MTSPRIAWLGSDDDQPTFPPVSEALTEPEGLLAAGGDLGIERLCCAYRSGIFPWYEAGQPILWWSPNPRCVFLPGDFHLARRLRRDIRRSAAHLRVNTAFGDVIRACAGPRRSEQGTWISADMIAAYEALHAAGWAHSIEVWQSGALLGGLYGVAIGRAFFGESMFSRESNASKLALCYLAKRLQEGAFELLDCQLESAHLTSLGARLIPRSEFIGRLNTACASAEAFTNWPGSAVACPRLLLD